MCLFQVVDAIADAPEVLFDLEEVFGVVEGSTWAPPAVRRNNSWTSLADGSIETDATYGDREVTIVLDGEHGTPEEQVANIQALARLMSSPRWLKAHLCGTAHPVFFRTRRADAQIRDFRTTLKQLAASVSRSAETVAL